MGGIDIQHKVLEEYDDVFTDIVNVLGFYGERIVSDFRIVADYFYAVRTGTEKEFYENPEGGGRSVTWKL